MTGFSADDSRAPPRLLDAIRHAIPILSMNRQLIHFSAMATRWLAIALLLAIPVGSGIAYAVGLAKHHSVRVFGRSVMGETSLSYVVQHGVITLVHFSGWSGASPPRSWVCNLPGLDVSRDFGPPGETSGEAMLFVHIRWWLLLLANIPPILLAPYLARPFLRRRHAPGRCPVCGYDLRATPTRCPECGTAAALRDG